MYNFYFNSGTTNTRAYLLKNNNIVAYCTSVIGSRDAALQKDKTFLVRNIYKIYQALCKENSVQDTDIEHIYLSGMVSCPVGIVEVEHLVVPIDKQALTQQVHIYFEPLYFQRKLEIFPGLKTLEKDTLATYETVSGVNNMRGEEVEIFGIMHHYPKLQKGNVFIVLPGSHTQVAFVRDAVVEDISSTVTGELYHAIVKHTIITSSVAGDEETEILPEMVALGYRNVQLYGFNRALYIVRTIELFMQSSLAHRRSYLEGVINAGVITAITKMVKDGSAQIAIAGSHAEYEIFSAFCRNLFPQFTVLEISNSQVLPFSVEGLLSLIHNT